MSIAPWQQSPKRQPPLLQWATALLVCALAVLLVSVFVLSMAQPGQPIRPIVVIPTAAPSPTPADPIIVTGTSSASSQTYTGSYWPHRTIVIDNQVSAAFAPLIQAQAQAWMDAGAPVTITVVTGGPPACDNGASGLVVLCLHTTLTSPGEPAPDDGDTLYTASCSYPGELACSAISETVWLRGVLAGQRLIDVLRHEIGHVLGLGWSPCSCSVMGSHATTDAITPDDIANLRALYDLPGTPGPAPVIPSAFPQAVTPPPTPAPRCTVLDVTLCGLLP